MEDGKAPASPSKRGFAALSVEQRRRIASMGGKAAHEKGTAHEFTTAEAVAAGKKRGQSGRKRAENSTDGENSSTEHVSQRADYSPVETK